MYQYTVIIGNVGRDPQLRYLPDGQAVCNFPVAVNRRWTDRQTGEQRSKATWFNVSCWGKLAENIHLYVTKGRLVLAEGAVEARAWTDREGNPRANLELRATDVKFLGSKDDRSPIGDNDLDDGDQGDHDMPF